MANKEQRKTPHVKPKSNKQKKEQQKEKKASKTGTGLTLNKD